MLSAQAANMTINTKAQASKMMDTTAKAAMMMNKWVFEWNELRERGSENALNI